MDIKNLNTNVSSGRAPEQLKTQEKMTGASDLNAKASDGVADKVTLTGMLTQVRDLEQKADKVNIDNSDRIASLKASIADGSYQVNAQKVAEKLIQSDTLLSSL